MNTRVMRFVVVGGIGFVLQVVTLTILTRFFGWTYGCATILAVEVAVLHNFRWHERWTWAERQEGSRVKRFIRFQVLTGFMSIAGNVWLTAFGVEVLGLHPVAANVVAVLTMTSANYALADRWAFRASRIPGAFRA